MDIKYIDNKLKEIHSLRPMILNEKKRVYKKKATLLLDRRLSLKKFHVKTREVPKEQTFSYIERKQFEAEKQELYNKILHHIEKERQVLLELKALKEHYKIIESRYYRLRNSLPGRVLVRIWKILKRFR